MTIALDATYSVGDDLSGIGVYSREILFGLAAAHPEARFRFCYRPHRWVRSRRESLPPNARRGLLVEPFWAGGGALFHGLNQRLPRIRLGRAVSTFHDLFVLTGDYSTPEFRKRFTAQARDAAKRSHAIITVSAFTASQVADLLSVEPTRIHVVHHGVRPLAAPDAQRENLVLHTGAIQKRKNLLRLVEAFEGMPPDWTLALVGSTGGYAAQQILARIERSSARQRIRVPGYVPAGELPAWYARARIFAFPSLDEGFGMPVLEAMASGVPVIASRRGALPEVCGGAAMLIDEQDADDLRRALLQLADSESLRDEMVKRGRSRASEFTWTRAVEETWRVYETLP
jgi:glycosyltransferase involved in cell wall biosynthesis